MRPIKDDLGLLTPDEKRILIHLLDFVKIDLQDAVEVLQLGKSKVHHILRELVSKGLIVRGVKAAAPITFWRTEVPVTERLRTPQKKGSMPHEAKN